MRLIESYLVRSSSRGEFAFKGTKLSYANRAGAELLGASKKQLKGLDLCQILPELDASNERGRGFAVDSSGKRIPVDYELRQRGKYKLLYLDDATERAAMEAKLREEAVRDPLTHVLNRSFLEELLLLDTENTKRYSTKEDNGLHVQGLIAKYGDDIGFLMIDVNNLKQVNDSAGHTTGDSMLKDVASLLNSCTRKSDFLIRYGGDEFLIVLPHTDGEIEIVTEKIRKEIDSWNQRNREKPYRISLAIGRSYWHSDEGKTLRDVLNEADRLMYKDKKEQKKKGNTS